MNEEIDKQGKPFFEQPSKLLAQQTTCPGTAPLQRSFIAPRAG
jgi:hypothetical protein